MNTSPSPTTVLVTGATGYVAGWLVRQLLTQGHTVHAGVRDPADENKRAHLDAMAAELPGELVYFKTDLLVPGSYSEAMAGCEVVFHTASPFTTSVSDPQRELVDPAVQGTQNVLTSANATASVRRVVVTSSCAAIYGDNIDAAKTASGQLSEADWNTTSSLHHQPYSFSKTAAETAAWEIAKAQNRWDLVTINPSLVLGPGTTPHATSESFSIIKQMADGTLKSGVPDLTFGVVDVRDVAQAHYLAGCGAEPVASGRYIVSGGSYSLLHLANVLRDAFGAEWPFPTRTLPKWLLWLVGPFVNKAFTRKMVSRNVGYPLPIDNSKSRNQLSLTYRPLQETLRDMFLQLVEQRIITRS